VAITTSVIFLAVHLFFSFPQLSYYLGMERWLGGVVSAQTANTANGLDKLRAAQRDRILREAYETATNWQRAHPGRELPEEMQKNFEAVKFGLSPREYEEKLKKEKAEAEAKAKAEAEAKAKAEAEAAKTPTPPPPPPPAEKKEAGWYLKIMVPGRNIPDSLASVEKSGEDLKISMFFDEKGKQEVCTYTGKMRGAMFEGTWLQTNPSDNGRFSLRFEADEKSAKGEGEDSKGIKFGLTLCQVAKK
jgi:hypothetical protein